jgi:hypothetical protein
MDSYFCDQFQELSDWLHDHTGKTCFWYAALILFTGFVIDFWRFWNMDIKLWEMVSSAVFVALYLRAIDRARKETSPSKMVANSVRIDPFWKFFRKALCIILLFALSVEVLTRLLGKSDLKSFVMAIRLVFDFCLAYLYACTPRPGSPHRAGKWVDAFVDFIFRRPAVVRY